MCKTVPCMGLCDMPLGVTSWFKANPLLSRETSLVAQRLKHLPPMWETWVWSLGREDPLEKEMVTHSSILAWRIPWTEKPGKLQSMGLQRVGHNWATSLSLLLTYMKGLYLKRMPLYEPPGMNGHGILRKWWRAGDEGQLGNCFSWGYGCEGL